MKALKPLVLFGVGGFIYFLIEILWRGHSHWTMIVVGGICFLLIGSTNEYFTYDMSLLKQMFISSVIITLVELISGFVLNICLGFNIWDYSNIPFNIYGQICLPYTCLWFLISLPAIILDDYFRYWWFEEEKPHYKIIKK